MSYNHKLYFQIILWLWQSECTKNSVIALKVNNKLQAKVQFITIITAIKLINMY